MERLWRLFPAVRRRERGRFLFFAGLYALLTLAQTLGLTGSEALFLAEIGVENLPWAFVLASAISVGGSLAYAVAVGRLRNDGLFIGMLVAAATALAGVAGILLVIGRWQLVLLPGLFCSFYLTQAVFVTHYRTFATDFFDTLTAKRLLPGFAVGSSLGGAVGGLLALALSRSLGPESLILGWAVALLAAALLLRAARRSLRSWGPLGSEERDESSVEGLRGALQYLQRSALSRWLVVSVVGMVFSLSLLQYLSSKVFVQTYPDPADLAGFFGIYLAASNTLEIAVVLFVTPWVIERFGIARANLLHPLLTTLTFGAVALQPTLAAAVLARADRELLENALAGEVRNLSYNALPYRFRGSLRALLEGMVFYAAMSIAGVALLLMGDAAQLRLLALVGIAASLLYAAANRRVRDEYLRGLVQSLRLGRLDLEGVRAGLGAGELTELSRQWAEILDMEEDRPSRAILELTELMAQRGITAPLLEGARRGSVRMRCACLDALRDHPPPASDDGFVRTLVEAVHDEADEVRLAAARAAARLDPLPEPLRRALAEHLGDPGAAVRAEAAASLGAEGAAVLRALASSADPAEALPALRALPSALIEHAASRIADPDPEIRAAALRRAGPRADSVDLDTLGREIGHADLRVRRAAADALAERPEAEAAAVLARALDDVARDVRTAAADALALRGELGVEAAAEAVSGARLWTVDAALSVLARSGTKRGRDLLLKAFAERVRLAWQYLLSLRFAPNDDSEAAQLLGAALSNAYLRNQRLAFRILELLDDPGVVRSVEKALRFQRGRARTDALEVLSNLGDRESAQLLALLLEEGSLEEKLPTAARSVEIPTTLDEVLRNAGRSPDRWLRAAAEAYSDGAASAARSIPEVLIVERLLALRNVPLFAHLSLDQLEAIARFVEERLYLSGDVIVREGEPGEELFVLLEGEVEVRKEMGAEGDRLINRLSPVSYFGEIAILDNAPRSATIVVSQDARVLTLAGDRFKELVLQAPEIAFQIMSVLTMRLRSAEEVSARSS